MRLRILVLLGACFAFGALAADKPVDVRDLMTATEFHDAGLDKLTAQELAALNAWLAANTRSTGSAIAPPAPAPAAAVNVPAALPMPAAAVNVPAALPMPAATAPVTAPVSAPSADSSSSFGQEMLSGDERGEPKRLEGHIVGTFTGWTGRTLFKLDNGQVWQQTDSTTYQTRLENPAVVIKRLSFGYLLTLTGHGATVFVKRVQ